MIEYNVEPLADCLEEIKPHLVDHYEEIALNRDKIKLNPDYDKYLEMAEMGKVHTVTVRDDGVLIGYYISFIDYNLHYKDCLMSINDILFVAKEHRRGSVGYKMIKYAEAKLKELGVHVMALHMKVDFPFEPLCEAMDMHKAEYMYQKYIGD